MNNKNIHLIYGSVSGFLMAITILIIYKTGSYQNQNTQYIAFIPYFLGILLNGFAFSKANGPDITFGNVFGSCFKAAMIVCLVIIIYSIASFYIFPEIKAKMLETMRATGSNDSKLTKEDVQKGVEQMNKFYGTMMISSTLFSNLFAGAVFSLLTGVIVKKGIK